MNKILIATMASMLLLVGGPVSARYYEASTARFLQEDPILLPIPSFSNSQGFDMGSIAEPSVNLYEYALNSPLNLSDPFGLAPYDPDSGRSFEDWWHDPTTTFADRGASEGITPTYLELDIMLMFIGGPKVVGTVCEKTIPKQYLRWGWRRWGSVNNNYRIAGDWLKWKKNPHINLWPPRKWFK